MLPQPVVEANCLTYSKRSSLLIVENVDPGLFAKIDWLAARPSARTPSNLPRTLGVPQATLSFSQSKPKF